MDDLKKHEQFDENGQVQIRDNTEVQSEADALTLRTKKRRTFIIWLRVIALMFAAFFFLSKCGMSKSDAKMAIMESCIQNVPFSPQWQHALKERNLTDNSKRVVADYCVCMWNDPLQKLGVKQIQSFAKISQQEQLELLGGQEAFIQRDKMCMDKLVK